MCGQNADIWPHNAVEQIIIYSVSLAVFIVLLQLRDTQAAPVSLPQSMISTLSAPLGEYDASENAMPETVFLTHSS